MAKSMTEIIEALRWIDRQFKSARAEFSKEILTLIAIPEKAITIRVIAKSNMQIVLSALVNVYLPLKMFL